MKSTPRIGTCGFGIAQSEYVKTFACVEVQHTFYQPPQLSTLERWRESAPPDFEFVMKAWQLITHDARSPTFRRLKRKLSDSERQEAGYFRPTSIVNEALEVTLACAKALKARTILFQCPASFKPTQENISNLESFFENLKRRSGDVPPNLCWEPRGDWDPTIVEKLCKRLKLWHVVDPFVARSVTPNKSYYRLHGRNGWRYQYEDGELLELAAMMKVTPVNHDASRKGRIAVDVPDGPYVFFNNARMTQDALRFRSIIEEG